MFKFIKTEDRPVNNQLTKVRLYRNDLTGTDVSTYLLHTDRHGGQWWTFEDLFALPLIRQIAAKKVIDLYGYGLSIVDIKAITAQMKGLLKSTDAEKYEKVYAKCLELEQLSSAMADPVKQCLGLSTVYLMYNDERPDAYVQAEQNVKMSVMSLDVDLQTFFLNWWTGAMVHSAKVLNELSRIASTLNA